MEFIEVSHALKLIYGNIGNGMWRVGTHYLRGYIKNSITFSKRLKKVGVHLKMNGFNPNKINIVVLYKIIETTTCGKGVFEKCRCYKNQKVLWMKTQSHRNYFYKTILHIIFWNIIVIFSVNWCEWFYSVISIKISFFYGKNLN